MGTRNNNFIIKFLKNVEKCISLCNNYKFKIIPASEIFNNNVFYLAGNDCIRYFTDLRFDYNQNCRKNIHDILNLWVSDKV